MKKGKLAFSLVETLISMIILGVFAAFALPIFTAKHEKKTGTQSHGSYFCVYSSPTSGGQAFWQKNNTMGLKNVASCVFTRDTNISSYSIVAIGGGANGNSSSFGLPGRMETNVITSLNENLVMTLGANGSKGATTIVKGQTSNKNYLMASGGQGIYIKPEGETLNYQKYGTSGVDSYIEVNSIKLETSNAAVKTALETAGNGGQVNGQGKYGAVIIVW